MVPVDVLAIFAHRDDAELGCGGTLAKLARAGRRTAILDLTRGELGTRGSAETRADEAAKAGQVLGLATRENLELPDAGVTNTPATRGLLARAIRTLRPQVVIAPALTGRHPDHRVTAELVRDACFVAGLAKVAPEHPVHRPRKILHAIAYREDPLKPTFVVDITAEFETKVEAIRCYASQFDGAIAGGELYPNGEPLYDLVRHHAAHYGSLIRCRYGEPFHTTETMRVDDIMTLEVATL
jgi:bacillithiol biosynthesis deacetylase BshB1